MKKKFTEQRITEKEIIFDQYKTPKEAPQCKNVGGVQFQKAGAITGNVGLIEESVKKDEKILTLECRLQDLTESKDIIHKELEETNCWYENQ